MSVFDIIFIFIIQYSYGIHQETTLTATHTSANDGSLSIFINTENVQVNTTTNIWHIDPQSQNSYDLLLMLNDEWIFHPNITSQIILEINGYTPSITTEDGEFLIVFSSQNDKYFSVVIRLDNHNTLWKYYPSSSIFATTNDVYNDIIRGGDSHNRWDRVSNNDEWSDILPKYKKALQWPLYLRLVNDPINNTLLYECTVNDVVLSAQYEDIFISDEMHIYIMNDADDGKPFDINGIKVQYRDNRISDITIESTVAHAITTTNVMNNAFNTTYIDTERVTEAETESVTETERATVRETVSTERITDIMLEAFVNDNDAGRVSIVAMIGILLGSVCVAVCIVLALWYYYKQKEEAKHDGLNKSEYRTPTLDVSNTDIENILEIKRKESAERYGEYNKRAILETQRTETQSIVPINSQYSEDDDESDDDEHQFNED